jgi:phospholipase C
MAINRRDFLRGAAGVSGAALAGSGLSNQLLARGTRTSAPLSRPDQSAIQNIVVLMMENRSFDHMLGWMPNARGRQGGLVYTDKNGVKHETARLTSFTGCPHPDPDHSYEGGRSEYDGGKMDGWLRTTTNDEYCIGYYAEEDLKFFSAFARNYTTLDNYFPSIMSSTFPNRMFSWAAQTDRLDNSTNSCSLPTILDTLGNAGVSVNYYFSNVPFLALWGTKYLSLTLPLDAFLLQASLGLLPSVSFVDPSYTLLDDGSGNDDHPHADLRNGEAFVQKVFNAVTQGPNWANTVLIVNRDEWGGFFEHIRPPRVIAPNDVDKDLKNGKALLGCRVPVVVASPFSKGDVNNPRINSDLYDHTSVLKFIEWRYGLPPLTKRDASNEIGNLASALDFNNPDPTVPSLPVVNKVNAKGCGASVIVDGHEGGNADMVALLKSERMEGWPVSSRRD